MAFVTSGPAACAKAPPGKASLVAARSAVVPAEPLRKLRRETGRRAAPAPPCRPCLRSSPSCSPRFAHSPDKKNADGDQALARSRQRRCCPPIVGPATQGGRARPLTSRVPGQRLEDFDAISTAWKKALIRLPAH